MQLGLAYRMHFFIILTYGVVHSGMRIVQELAADFHDVR